jgi:hypothetical protein
MLENFIHVGLLALYLSLLNVILFKSVGIIGVNFLGLFGDLFPNYNEKASLFPVHVLLKTSMLENFIHDGHFHPYWMGS